MFFDKVCKALQKEKIQYAIVGGYAVAIHGVMRGTFDIDIAIRWTLKNLTDLEKTLKNLGLMSRVPVTADNVFHFRDEFIQNRNMIAWNFYDPINPQNQIDVIINYDLKKAKVDTVNLSSGTIKVLSKKDLIEMKKKAGRKQDLEDIKALERL